MAKKRKGKGTRSTCLSQDQIAWAYDKWCTGYSLKEIASKLYVSESTVSRCLRGRKKVMPPLDSPKV